MHTMSSIWSELLGQCFQMFTKPGTKMFLSLMTGWVHRRTSATAELLAVTRYLDETRKMKYDYHLSSVSADTPLEELARVSKGRNIWSREWPQTFGKSSGSFRL